MYKVFWGILGGIGFLVAWSYGIYHESQAPVRAFDDYRQIVKPNGEIDDAAVKNLKPKSDYAKEILPYLQKIRVREAEFLKRPDENQIGKALNWDHIDTPEKRVLALRRIDKCVESWRAYCADLWKIRRDMAEAADFRFKQTLTEQVAETNAEEGRLLRARNEVFDECRAVVLLVGKAKLVEVNGKTMFDDIGEHARYKEALKKLEKDAADFDRKWFGLLARQKQDRADKFDRMASAANEVRY